MRRALIVIGLGLMVLSPVALAATLIGGEQINRVWTIGTTSVGLVISGNGSQNTRPAFRILSPSGDVSFEARVNGQSYYSGAVLINLGGKNGTGIILDPGVALELIGTASGKNLYASQSVSGTDIVALQRFSGAGLSDCDTAGSSKMLWDASTKRFSCGTDQNGASGVNTGGVLVTGDARYLKRSGGTMTGLLTIDINNGSFNTVGLKILNTASGAHLHAESALTSSGSFTWEKAASGATLYIATSLNGAGLTDCDAATQTLAWDSTAGRFSCGTDSDTTYNPGQGLTLNGGTFRLNATVTGSTVSGAHLVASRSATVSGSLLVKSSITSKGSLSGATIAGFRLGSCNGASQKLLYDNSSQVFACGTDLSGAPVSVNTGGVLSLGDARYVRKSGGTMTGPLVIDLTSGFLGLKIVEMGSGNIFHVEKELTSSGTLTILGRSYFRGTLSGSNLHAERSVSASGSISTETTLSGSALIATTVSGSFARFRQISPTHFMAQVYASGSTVAAQSGTVLNLGPIPPTMSGFNLTAVYAAVDTAGTTGLLRLQIRDVQKGKRPLFSTALSIDSGEKTSETAATAYVINQSNDDVGFMDQLSIDVLQVHTTAPKGLHLTLRFDKP